MCSTSVVFLVIEGVSRINKAAILESIPMESLGNIFIIDKLFADPQRIQESINKTPQGFGPLGSPLTTGSSQDEIETQTVVIDLVAELLG